MVGNRRHYYSTYSLLVMKLSALCHRTATSILLEAERLDVPVYKGFHSDKPDLETTRCQPNGSLWTLFPNP
jgi:hypothetical protein